MPVLTSETRGPAVSEFANPLPPLLAKDLNGSDDINSNLWDICGVLAKGGFNDGNTLADMAEQGLAGKKNLAFSVFPLPA